MSNDTPPDPDKLHPETLAIHAGRSVDPVTGAVTPPIHPSTTFERDRDGSYSRGHDYTRGSNPTRRSLEQCLATLEGADHALAFASGSAAGMAVFQCLRPGDHVLVTEDAYHGTRHQLASLLADWDIDHDRIDTTSPAAVAEAMRAETRLLWIESPSNPLQRVADLKALTELARAREVVTVCDNTLATPVFQQPLAHGIDLVVHSTTKYLGGHSDLLGGALMFNHGLPWRDRLGNIQASAGAVPSPWDAWLLLRSLSSLPLRVHRQAESAGELARRLGAHPAVAEVIHPGLDSHPQHALAQRYLPGGTGLLAVRMRDGEKAAWNTVNATRLFTRATSLGGVESLIEHRASIEGSGSLTPPDLIRISVGLEHPDDLWRDLEQAIGQAS